MSTFTTRATMILAALAVGLTMAPAQGTSAPKPEVLAKGLVGPLSAAVAKDGSIYVTGNFSGTLVHVVPGEKPAVMWQAPEKGAEVGAVSTLGKRVVFGVIGKKSALLWEVRGSGMPTALADIRSYEKTKNPDRNQAYGFESISAECAAQLPQQIGPAQYTGIVDSHPYATEITSSKVYLADAGANAILAINGKGKVSTVAVLPTTDVLITAEIAAAAKLPECVVGLTYRFEPVPTDVEMGPDGKLYVSSLPGGPEDGSTGPQGRVYRVSPGSGAVKLVAQGLVSPVNVAVANNGDLYVSQLFAGSIVRIKAGSSTPKPFIDVNMPGALEWTKTALVGTTDVLAKNGKLVRFPF